MEQPCLVSRSSNPVKFLKELMIKTNKQDKPSQSFLLSAGQRVQLWYNALSKHWSTEDWLSGKTWSTARQAHCSGLCISSARKHQSDFVVHLSAPVPVWKSTKSPLRTFSPEEGWAKVITLVPNCHRFALLCEALQKPVLSPTQKIYSWDVRMSSSRSPVGLLCASTLFIRSALLLCPLHRDAHESNQEIRGDKPEPLCFPGVVSRDSVCVLLFACVVTTD